MKPKLLARVRSIFSALSTIRPSAPVTVLVIALALLTVFIVCLLSMGRLRSVLQSPAFQGAAILRAVASMIFACIQFWDSRRHSGAIKVIAQSMSTGYIGQFPNDLDEIVKVITVAAEEVLIMADFAAYGSFSKP